jgi:adenosine/AMP kinase
VVDEIFRNEYRNNILFRISRNFYIYLRNFLPQNVQNFVKYCHESSNILTIHFNLPASYIEKLRYFQTVPDLIQELAAGTVSGSINQQCALKAL